MAEPSPKIFQNVVQHVFMPPKLPQQAPKDEQQCAIDLALVRLVQDSIKIYRNQDSIPQERWNRMHKMLSQVAQVLETPLGAERLERSLSRMENKGM